MSQTPMSQTSWEELARKHQADKLSGKKPAKPAPKLEVPDKPTDQLVLDSEADMIARLEAILKNDPGKHAPTLIYQLMYQIDRVIAAQLRQQTAYLGRIQWLEESLHEHKEAIEELREILLEVYGSETEATPGE